MASATQEVAGPSRAGVWFWALLVGVLAGFTVMFVSNALIYGAASTAPLLSHLFGFWGLVYGPFAAVVVFGIALAVLSRRSSDRSTRVGLRIAAASFIVFGLVVVSWIAMWRLPLTTLEGLWIYPLGFGSLVCGAFLLTRARPR